MSEKLGQKKRRELLLSALNQDTNDSWAVVELYRWQHGELPKPNASKPASAIEGLRGMARAFSGDSKEWPHPMNVASVLEYAAKLLENPDMPRTYGGTQAEAQTEVAQDSNQPREQAA